MTVSDSGTGAPEHPWCGIGLDVYEAHMGDERVGQLRRLHDITREQLAAYRPRRVGVLGVAGGNGLDLIDPDITDGVYGYDINPDYLAACDARYRTVLGDRLHLVEASIDRSVKIEPVDLLIANLIIEYIGVEEFGAFAAANAQAIGVLSCVLQRNDTESFVSSTEYASSFAGLATVSADVEAETLTATMTDAGFTCFHSEEYRLPNGKTLVRHDYR